ncbi:ABC transporter permease [Paenactinomyces guangxiensis]|uniref:ABC transporter permease subunit n=1 Tax=Paenactinomyces guangxiensis TaxID=1490290 RepID=A0A7W2A7Z6_9BACL|nr:ABC transporter permease subunit [Paenactinomyces guangxiensis]MBA4493637.1 ABC transporter permease subunit [Paenactinomyces guangxiensis]MBH8590924.1 ABC transporter permease subunit [Paenactinomyces guangxiensis]
MKQLWQRWTNPVLAKEFQWRMRSKKTPWLISLYLLIMGGIILTLLFLFKKGQNWFDPEESMFLFTGLSMVQLLMLSFVVPGITAGVISGERERQTMPILLTTTLSSTKIVLSKWLASLSFMILLLVASFPLYIIVFLFGGISPEQVVKMFVHFFVTMIFLGSLGIFFSSLIKRTGVATVLAYMTVALIGIGLLVVLYLVTILYAAMNPAPSFAQNPPLIAEIVAALHPGITLLYAQYSQFDFSGLKLSLNLYDVYITFYSILSVLLLIGSIYLLSPVRFRIWKWARKTGSTENMHDRDATASE